MKCKYCKNTFSTKTSLNTHKMTAKYCLQIRGMDFPNKYKCSGCSKNFSRKYELNRHVNICKKESKLQVNKIIKDLQDKHEKHVKKLEQIIKDLQDKIENNSLRREKELREDLNKLALKAVSRSTTTNNKTIQINNYLNKMEPLRLEDMKKTVPMLTMEHHVQGAEGYAKYALENPFKNKLVCLDNSRGKFKYKNEDGIIIEDNGLTKMMPKLCKLILKRSYLLSQQHLEKLSKKYPEKELFNYNFMENSISIATSANGTETGFCKKIIKIIGNNTKIP